MQKCHLPTDCKISSSCATTMSWRTSLERFTMLTTAEYDFPTADSPFTCTMRSPVKKEECKFCDRQAAQRFNSPTLSPASKAGPPSLTALTKMVSMGSFSDGIASAAGLLPSSSGGYTMKWRSVKPNPPVPPRRRMLMCRGLLVLCK